MKSTRFAAAFLCSLAFTILVSGCTSTEAVKVAGEEYQGEEYQKAIALTVRDHSTNAVAEEKSTRVAEAGPPTKKNPLSVQVTSNRAATDTRVATDTRAAINTATATGATAESGNLWERIRQGFAFTEITATNPKAQKLVDRYQRGLPKNHRLIEQVGENAAPWLHFVVSELEKNNMPLELALVPVIESRYDPFAYSPGHASGLWQFIPATGRRFGLHQDWWHDQRRDVIVATGSAIQYLLYLYQRFDNDWLLALAAYNSGQGNVARTIRKNRKQNRPTDYWSLDLPRETRHYIPKLLAWRHLLVNASQYQVTLPPIPDRPYFSIVDVGSQIDLAKAANLAEIDIDTIYRLNPAWNRWATDPAAPHELLMPVAQATVFQDNLKQLPYDQRMTWYHYVIKRHDSLIKIAREFNTTPTLIVKSNGLKNHRIREGESLLIPSPSGKRLVVQTGAMTSSRHGTRETRKLYYTVKPGDSLAYIADRFQVQIKDIKSWNNALTRQKYIHPGQLLTLYVGLTDRQLMAN